MIGLMRIARYAWAYSVGLALIGCNGTGSEPSASYPCLELSGTICLKRARICGARANFRPHQCAAIGTKPTSRSSTFVDAPGATADSLLYVSSVGNGVVDVYDGKTGEQEGGLSGLQYRHGQCVDAAGEVLMRLCFRAPLSPNTRTAARALSTTSRGEGTDLNVPFYLTMVYLVDLSWVDVYGSSQCGGVWVYPDASGTPTLYSD